MDPFSASSDLRSRASFSRAALASAVQTERSPVTASTPKRLHLRSVGGAPNRSEDSERELFEGVLRGDERIAVELYHRLLPVIEASLLRVLGRREVDHEDLVQTAFEQLILTLARGSYAGTCGLKTWASSIAAHVALKAIRSRYRQRRVFNPSVEPHEVTESQRSSDDVERTLVSRQQLESVRAALAELAPAKAEAVLLHDVLGHGLSEIASLTGSSVAAAQTRLSRGRRELAERLEERARREGDV